MALTLLMLISVNLTIWAFPDDPFLEELDERLPLLWVLDALISEIPTQWQNDLPSPFQCRLLVYPRDRADQMRKSLLEAMPILSRRQLVAVHTG